MSSSNGLHIQSLFLRFLRLGIDAFGFASSSSNKLSSAFRSAISSSSRISEVSESDTSDVWCNLSITGVGINSSSRSRKHTCLIRGNRTLAVLGAVEGINRDGNGLLRRILRAPIGKQYGAVAGKKDVHPEDDVVAQEGETRSIDRRSMN